MVKTSVMVLGGASEVRCCSSVVFTEGNISGMMTNSLFGVTACTLKNSSESAGLPTSNSSHEGGDASRGGDMATIEWWSILSRISCPLKPCTDDATNPPGEYLGCSGSGPPVWNTCEPAPVAMMVDVDGVSSRWVWCDDVTVWLLPGGVEGVSVVQDLIVSDFVTDAATVICQDWSKHVGNSCKKQIYCGVIIYLELVRNYMKLKCKQTTRVSYGHPVNHSMTYRPKQFVLW